MTTTTPLVETDRGVLRRWFRPLVAARTWKQTASLLLALPLGVLWSTLVVTGLATSAGLIVTLVGLPLLVAVVVGGRAIGAVERSLARRLLDAELAPPPPIDRTGTVWARGRRTLRDGPGWRGLAYGVLALPVGIATFTAAVVMWTVAAAMAAFPVYGAFISQSGLDDVPDALTPFVDGWGRGAATIGVAAIGVALLAAAPRVIDRLADAQRRFVGHWLVD